MPVLNYGKSFYIGAGLKLFAKLYTKHIPEDVSTLVCATSSGAMIAAAILQYRRNLRICYIKQADWTFNADRQLRKGLSHSGFSPDVDSVICFVDDLIDRGHTFKAVYSYIADRYHCQIKYAVIFRFWSGQTRDFCRQYKNTKFIVINEHID